MKMMPTIYKCMKPFFRDRGYLYERGSFYKIRNHIAYCIYFSRPSDLVYVQLYILPLYMQTEEHHITYGNRICSMYQKQLPTIHGNSNEEDIVTWCNILQDILCKDVFAFFDQIGSPEKLLECLDSKPERIRRYLFCGDYRLKLISVYTCLYLQKYDRLPGEIEQCRIALASFPFNAAVKERENKELDQLEHIAMSGNENVDAFFQKVINKSKFVCFKLGDDSKTGNGSLS